MEPTNETDKYAVAVLKNKIVGHLPKGRKIRKNDILLFKITPNVM